MTLSFFDVRDISDRRSRPDARSSVSSRLLAVLGCFDLARQVLSLTEIAAATGLPLSTARRLIVELVRWGALERLADGRYRIGTRLWCVGILAAVQRELGDVAAPFLQELSASTGTSAHLVVLDGFDALCVGEVAGPDAVPTRTFVGGRLPLHATAVGKVLLAHSSPALLAGVVSRGLERRTPRTIVEPGRLAASIREVRSTGVGRSQEEMTLGAASVAAAVNTSDGSPVAAIGLVTHSRRSLDPLVPAVLAVTRRVSQHLQEQAAVQVTSLDRLRSSPQRQGAVND